MKRPVQRLRMTGQVPTGDSWSVCPTGSSSAVAPAPTQRTSGGDGLVPVGCTRQMFCVAMSEDGDSYVHNASEWSSAIPVGMADPGSVSCPSPGFCAAVGGAFEASYAVLLNGRQWGQVLAIDTEAALRSGAGLHFVGISCPNDVMCRAVGDTGMVAREQAGSWGRPQQVTSPGYNQPSISCGTSASCVVVDITGKAERL